jgi:ketopantoate reductase
MKIVILGAGALGSVLAAHLARAGQDVSLIARGERPYSLILTSFIGGRLNLHA